jgi:WD40 repeat protein
MGVISFLLLTSIFGLVYSQRQKSESDRNAALATEQSTEALKQKELAEQQRVLAEQKQQEADQQAKIAQEQSALALTQKQEAERQRQLANSLRANAEEGRKSAVEEKEKADAAKLEAEKYSQLAEKNSQLANQEKENATRFRMLAIAQAMGAKASQLQDKDQKVLVAQQAYQFNKQYNGYAFQPDIYSGLYSAYEAVNNDKFNTTSLHQGAIKGLIALAPNIFITAGADGKIIKTDLSTNPPTVTPVDSHSYVFQCIALSADKRLIAIGSEEGKLLIYDATTLKKVRELDVYQSALWALAFDAHKYLYTVSNDKTILRWDVGTFESTPIMNTGGIVNSLSINNSDGSMAAGLSSGEVLLLKISDGGATQIGKVSGAKPVTKVKFNTAGTMLAIGKEDGSIVLWDVASSEISQSLTGHQAMVSDLQFSGDDLFLLSASYDGTSMLWNMKSINERQVVFADHGGWVLQATFNPNGRDLVTGDALGSLRYFPLNMEFYSTDLCNKIKRNMTEKEWSNFVSSDIPYQKTCDK